MKKEEFNRMWRVFLAEIGKSGSDVARDIGITPGALNLKMRNATIRYTDLSDIVEKYGYSIEIHKKPN